MMPCCGGVPVAQPLTFITSPQMQGRVPGQTFPLPLDATMNVMGSVDDFNRPDSSSLGPGWTTNLGVFNISGGRLCCDGSGANAFARFSRDGQPPDDQYVEVRVAAFSGVSTALVSPGVRGSLDIAVNKPGYYVEVGNFSNIRLWKNTNGSLLATSGVNAVAGDVIRLEVVGSSLTVKRNGIVIIGPFTDATVASGWPFMRGFGTSTTAVQIDDFKCDGMPGTNPVKATSHGLPASMSTFAGAVAKLTARSLAAAMSTFAGAVAKLTAHALDAAGMSTFAGALSRQAGKALPASMSTFAGTIVKRTSHAITGAMSTFAGAVAKRTAHGLTASMSTFAGAIVKRTGHSLAAGMSTFAGAIVRLTGHNISAGMSTFAGDIVGLSSRIRRWVLKALGVRPQMDSAGPSVRPQHSVRDRKVRGDK